MNDDEPVYNIIKYGAVIPLAWCEPCDNPRMDCSCLPRRPLPRVTLRHRLAIRLYNLRYAVASLIYPGDLDYATNHTDCE